MNKKNIHIDRVIKLSLSAIAGILFFANLAFAENLNPYSFDQIRNLQPVLQESFMPAIVRVKKPQDLPNSAPQSPTVVSDRDGNKFVYEDGKLRLKIDEQGNQTLYAQRLPRFERSYSGRLTKTYEYEGPMAKIKNEHGEITGYQQFGQGGLLTKEYDEENNLVKTHIYKNRTLEWVLDDLDGSRMKYNIEGPEYKVDFEENAQEHYANSNRRVQQKTEMTLDETAELVYGTKIVYDDRNHPLYVLDYKGNKILTYNYGPRFRLESTVDQYGNITEYNEERPMLIRNPHLREEPLKVWNWDGTKLISTEDKINHSILGFSIGVITYYKNNKPTEARFLGQEVVGRWVYDKGKTLVHWKAGRDGNTPNKVSLYDRNGTSRQAVSFNWRGREAPAHNELYNWAKNKKPVMFRGQAQGLWDEEVKEYLVFEENGRIDKIYPRKDPPNKDELLNQIF